MKIESHLLAKALTDTLNHSNFFYPILKDICPMPRVCYFTGKKTSFGNQVTHRGKAKYLGGVGTKITGVTSRKFKPNIQKVRALVNGRIVRIKVSAKAIRNGLVVKPVRRNYTKPAAPAAA
jgi:large subunit ribosomal protein L28